MGVGLAQGALDEALAYAKERQAPSASRSRSSRRSRPRSPTSRPRSRPRACSPTRRRSEKDAGKNFTLTAAQAKLKTGVGGVRSGPAGNRAVIRFAGDSGDGMQLVGGRFTAATAQVGNDLSTLPGLPGRDPRARRHAARRLRLPDPLRLARHPHPGRPPQHAGRDEPGGAESQPRRARGGRHADRQRGRLHRQQPAQGRLRGEPARGRHARRLPGLPRADDDDHDPRDRGDRGPQGGRGAADQERLRPRADLLDVRAAGRGDDLLAGGEIRQECRRSATPTSPPSKPATTSARRPRSRRPRSRSSRRRWRPASTATSTAPRRWRWA